MIQTVRERTVVSPHFENRTIVAPVKMVGAFTAHGENIGNSLLIPFYWNPVIDEWLSVETFYMRFGASGNSFTGTMELFVFGGVGPANHEVPAPGYIVYASGSHNVSAGDPTGAQFEIVQADDSLSLSSTVATIPIPDESTGKSSWAHVFENPIFVDSYDRIAVEVTATGNGPDDPLITLAFKLRLVPS